MKYNPTSIKASYIFNLLAVCLLLASTILYYKFENTKDKIYDVNTEANLKYVQSLANNLSNDILRVAGTNLIDSIKTDDILREYIESDLKLFVTTKYNHIYILVRDGTDDNFNIIANSVKNAKERSELLNIYDKFDKSKLLSIYKNKKYLYLEDKNINAVYINPMILDGDVKALIVINFTLAEQETIKSELEALKNIFILTIIFFIVVFIFILIFSYLDAKREKEKKMAFEKLEESNKMLILERTKLDELNDSLEHKIKEAVHQNELQNKKILQQSKLAQMGEMISMIAHQWRQPLSAINSTSLAISLKTRLGKLDDKTTLELTKKISDYSQHLSSTIDDFREFFKPNKEKKTTCYNEIVESVLNIIEVSILNKNIKITKQLECDFKFNSYPNEIKQVILNLVKNAEDVLLDLEIENPEIVIKSHNKVLTISDNGGGIPDDIMDKIFDPYFSTKTKKDGTGLGLYMSKTIIEEHCGGVLNTYNDENGAVFEIILKGDDE